MILGNSIKNQETLKKRLMQIPPTRSFYVIVS